MKCSNCNLCLEIHTLEYEGMNKLFWFCELCHRVFKLKDGKRFEIEDKEESDIVKDKIMKNRKGTKSYENQSS